MEIRWLGHSAFQIRAAGKNVLIDPYFTGNPVCPADVEESLGKVDYILVTHGHADHVGDTPRIAKANDATVVCMVEVAKWVASRGYEKTVGMNLGGTVHAEGLSFTMVNALHSSSYFDESGATYMGVCAGFVIKGEGQSVYHAGDTDIFGDMALIQRLHEPRVGLLPIGGHFTMDAKAAALACNELLDLEVIVPMHFKTFPVLAEGAEDFAGMVKRGRVEVLQPGESLTV